MASKIQNRFVNDNTLVYLAAFLLPALLVLAVLVKLNITPFGNNSIAIMDADIQYVDFFRYYRNVLLGDDSITYSFSNFFGESSIALFAYYLASPLNLFILLFPVGSEYTFFSFLLLMKIALAGMTAAVLLRNVTELPAFFTLVLSTGYSMMQYEFWQAQNIMWLDGPVFLPLMLLGMLRLMETRFSLLYILALAGSVLSNWYTAYFNCIAVLFFFLWWFFSNVDDATRTWKQFGVRFCRLAVHTVIGLLISMALFLPTIVDLMQGKARGSELTSWLFNRNILNITSGFAVGSENFPGHLVLFSGSMVLLGIILFFSLGAITAREKAVSLITFVMFLLFCYYTPFEYVANGFRTITAYWCRYGYLPVLFIVLLAAKAFDQLWREREKDHGSLLLKCGSIASILLLLPNYVTDYGEMDRIMETVLFLVVEIIAFSAILKYSRKSAYAVLAVAVAFELVLNGVLVLADYGFMDNERYKTYAVNQNRLITQLKQKDSSFYRTAELSYRLYGENNTSLYFNGPMADSFPGLTHYSSTTHEEQILLMKALGFSNHDMVTIHTTHLLPAESLLGAKYMVGEPSYPGFAKTELPEQTFKPVWENPYVVAPAVVLPEGRTSLFTGKDKSDPLAYQEMLFSQLTGHEVSLYQELAVSETRDDKMVHYRIDPGDEKTNEPIYGTVHLKDADYDYVNDLFVDSAGENNGEAINRQHGWPSPQMFEIPQTAWDEESRTYQIALLHYDEDDSCIKEASVYRADLTALKQATDEINSMALDQSSFQMENGHVTAFVKGANQGSTLLLSVPKDSGWTVTVNGRDVTDQTGTFAECFFMIPLEEGDCEVDLQYRVPGLRPGIVLSVIGSCLTIAFWWLNRKKYT